MIKYDDNYIKNRNSFPLATYTCKYVNCFDRESVTIHYHKDFEILYIDKGFADVQISGKNYSVGSGTLILINPFEPHSIIVRSPNYSHRCICFDIGLLDLKNEEEILSGELSYKNIILNSASLLPYFDLSYKSEKEKQDGWELRSQGSLLLMFSLLSECVEKSKILKEGCGK